MSGVRVVKPRESRLNVMIKARMRAGATWSDACILNLSTRGMLVRSADSPERGSYLEIRRGAHVIVARVVWSKPGRFGVHTQDPVPAGSLILDSDKPAAATSQGVGAAERRAPPRPAQARHEDSRLKSRAIEFGAILLVGAAMTAALGQAVAQALAEPLLAVNEALASN